MEFTRLTTEELKVIAKEKNKYGSATENALRAQSIIWERAGRPFNKPNYNYERNYYDD